MNKLCIVLAASLLASRVPALADNDPTTATLSAQYAGNPNHDFAPDPGLQASYLMLEGSGTVLHDSSGFHRDIGLSTACVPSNWASSPALPTWSADGGLLFGSSAAYQCLPSAVQNIQTVEVSFGSAVQWKDTTQANANPLPGQPGLVGYNGAAPAPSLLLSTGYTGNSVPGQGYATTYVGSYMSGDGSGVATTGTVDAGRHTVVMEISPTTGARTIWLDGMLQPALGSFSSLLPATSKGSWSFGGTSLGTFNNAWSQNGCLCTIYGVRFSTTALSTQQVAQDTMAWTRKADYAGSRPASSYGPTVNGPYLFTMGESFTHGYGLANEQTQVFTFVARSLLTTATGQTWKADTDGIDSASAYSADTHCRSLFPALAPGVHGAKFALLHSNGNDERGYNNWPTESVGSDAAVAATAYHSLAAMGACAAVARANGWITILGMENSSGNAGQGADAHQKDITNPIWRAGARQYFDLYLDTMNDPRMGVDGAATAHSASGDTSCTLAGTAGPMFQAGAVHLTACGNDVVGQDLALLVSDWIGSHNGVPPDTVSTATAAMALADAGNTVVLASPGAATYTLLQCGGQMQGEVLVTVKNAGSAADTILPGTEPDGGVADTMNGGTAGFSLPAGKTASFLVTRGTDSAGTCGIVSSS